MTDRPLKSTRLTVSLEDQDHAALTEIAAAKDVSLSWVIRQAIRRYVEKESLEERSPTKREN
jgi:predicted transcriptional regulator